jgi:Secretion system C-terminal sorting domain
MKKISYIIPFLFCVVQYANAQTCGVFDFSRPCQINVNTNYVNFNSRENTKRATVKYIIPNQGGCTGTLINTSDNRQLLITAAHCLKTEGALCSGSGTPTYQSFSDPGTEFIFVFNYQSPTNNTTDVPTTNRGCRVGRTLVDTDNLNNIILNGYEYLHRSHVRLLYFTRTFGDYTDCLVAGDMAVLEIINPIPPHFNVYYAGWSPETFNRPPYAVIHHPRLDIKKISEINAATTIDSGPPSWACNTVTQIIDVLFGWIWGGSVSTSVVCNYIESQHYTTSVNRGGGVEPGSSGSGLFDLDNQLVGVCSGSSGGAVGSACSDIRPVELYGKFRNQYNTQHLRSILNPTNDMAYHLLGMGGWQRTFYPVLSDLNGVYFPANHYQAQNKIRLNSASTISNSSTQSLTVLNGADYEFNATGAITIEPGFEAQLGSDVSFNTGVTQFQTIEQKPNPARGLEKLPKYKEFAMEETMKAKHYESREMDIIPNPMTTRSVLTWNNPNNQVTHIRIADVSGRLVNELQKSFGSQTVLDRNDLNAGFYFVSATLEDGTVYTRKLIITDK